MKEGVGIGGGVTIKPVTNGVKHISSVRLGGRKNRIQVYVDWRVPGL